MACFGVSQKHDDYVMMSTPCQQSSEIIEFTFEIPGLTIVIIKSKNGSKKNDLG